MHRSLVLACGLLCVAHETSAQTRERVRPNDNRARSGVLVGNQLALRMEARLAEWHPQGDDQLGAVVPVFAEIGRQASIPGPLIRVPAGTLVRIVMRNAVPNTILTVHGLHSRPAIGAAFNDSVQFAYGQIRSLEFKLDRPGTYYYWGTTTNSAFGFRTHEDAQLTGAIVVDEAGQRAPKDRIFVIGMWADTPATSATRHRNRELFVINGKSWPYTDRLSYERGDTVKWRVINSSTDDHPMHLHGQYFRVRRRGDGKVDTAVSGRGDQANTEPIPPGGTVSMQWVADRLGNWLFHCHIPEHFAARGPLGYTPQRPLSQAGTFAMNAPSTEMGGLVTAIEVKPAEDDTTALPPVISPVPPNARRLRMLFRPNVGSTPNTLLYGVALMEGTAPEAAEEAGQRAGPPLVLTKGEPVSITVVNRLTEATSVHWHGIELDSYFDGVPAFSGMKPQLAPAIAPNDSFEVHFTPPRSGTFIYHAHMNEIRQHRAGLVGALIVVDKGKFDPTRDIPIVVSSPSDSVTEEGAVLINGSATPQPVYLRRATAARLRLINITTARPGLRFELRASVDTLATWRPLAKDGADLPQGDRVLKPARRALSIGETADYEFFPTRPGDYKLEAQTSAGSLLASIILRVQ